MVNKRACDNKAIGGLRCSTIEYVLGHITHVKPVIAVPIAWARANERFGCQSKSMQKCHTKRGRKMPPRHSRASSLARSLHFVSGFVCPTLAAHYSLKSQTSQTDGRTDGTGEHWRSLGRKCDIQKIPTSHRVSLAPRNSSSKGLRSGEPLPRDKRTIRNVNASFKIH